MLVSNKFRRKRDHTGEGGYLLLVLLLFVTLLVIAATAAMPSIVTQIRRDREEEMIHRGVQYARAIKRFYKTTGRYPANLQQLESFQSNKRFLRRRYLDPITGKPFRLLHYGEVKMFPMGVAGLAAPGIATMPGAINGPGTPLGQSVFGNRAAMSSALAGAAGMAAAMNPAMNPAMAQGMMQAATGAPGMNTDDGSGTSEGENGQPQSGNAAGPMMGGQPLGNQSFGGMPVVGVASTSHKDTIREFSKKHHYNEWQFIYEPTMDRGGLLTGPSQPPQMGGFAGNPMPGAGQVPGMGVMPGQFPQMQMPGQGFGANPGGFPGAQIPPDQNQQQQ